MHDENLGNGSLHQRFCTDLYDTIGRRIDPFVRPNEFSVSQAVPSRSRGAAGVI